MKGRSRHREGSSSLIWACCKDHTPFNLTKAQQKMSLVYVGWDSKALVINIKLKWHPIDFCWLEQYSRRNPETYVKVPFLQQRILVIFTWVGTVSTTHLVLRALEWLTVIGVWSMNASPLHPTHLQIVIFATTILQHLAPCCCPAQY